MTASTDTALATIVLYAFNEARYVADAVRSMLDQDYANLEIVLSDDGSTDDTFTIMQRMAAEYRGPHKVMLNRNPTNIGIGSQINAAVAMSQGGLVVLANADDISRTDRVSRSVRAWRGEAVRPMAVWSALQQIDESGNPLERVMDMRVDAPDLATGTRNRFSGGGAASLALDRRVFDEFGPLPANLILEDSPLFARAMLLGPVAYLEEPLVDYRVHAENISQTYAVAGFEAWCQRTRRAVAWHRVEGVKAYLQILRDLHQKPAAMRDPAELAAAQWVGMEKLLENAILRDYYRGDTAVGEGVKLRSLLRLAVLLGKCRIKRMFPSIERRNERQHYQRTIKASKGAA